MPDYIPASDGNFDSWQANFVSKASDNLAALGLEALDLEPVELAQTAWASAYPAHVAARATARSARQDKDAARFDLEGAIRPLVRRLQASMEVSDAERAMLGITIPDREPSPAPPPTTRPVVSIDAGQRLRHTITFADQETPQRKAKPAGVAGAEVWVTLTPVTDAPPADPASYTFLGLESRSRAVADFKSSDGGKTAHYLLRWVNSRGDKGPWSMIASATVGA
jgi:hypothetical protein